MNRKFYLKTLAEQKKAEELDEFTKRSLDGYQYLPKGTSPESILERIDKKIDQQTGKDKGKIRRLGPTLFSIAATVSILVLAGVWLLSPSKNNEAKDLFVSYYEPLAVAIPNAGIDRGPAEYSYQISPVEMALKSYETGAYEEANRLFESLPDRLISNTSTRFYYSLSLLSAGRVQEAIALLEPLAQVEDIKYRENSQWYLALAYIKNGEREKAKTSLKRLKGSNYYQHKAASLLKEL